MALDAPEINVPTDPPPVYGSRTRSVALGQAVGYFLSLLILRLGLDACYYLFITPSFLDHFFLPMGLELRTTRYLVSLAVYVAGISIASYRVTRVSNLFYFIAIAFVYAPLTTMFGMDAGLSGLPVAATLASLAIVRFLTIVDTGRALRMPSLAKGDSILVSFAVVMVLAVVGWSFVSGAAGSISFSLADIYLNREDLSRLSDVGLMAYVNLWTYKVFNIILLSAALTKRRYGLAMIALGIQIFFFGVTAQRMVLFLPILSVGVWFFYRRKLGLAHLAMTMSAGLMMVLGASVYFDLFELGSIAIRRAFFVPAAATFQWFDYFGQHAHVFWSDRVLSGIVTTEYSGQRIPFLIGEHLAPGGDVSANNGMVSSGYAHAGMAGVLIYAVIFGLYSRACDRLVKNGVSIVVMAAVLVGPVRTAWADSDLLTTLLTHGLVVSLISLWAYGRGAEARRGLRRLAARSEVPADVSHA